MASPAADREARHGRQVRAGLPYPLAALALTTLSLAGCGGADDSSKVEASLRQYVSTVVPEQSGFPLGAGFPSVRENSCKKIPVGVRPAHIPENLPTGLSGWSCVVALGRTPLPVVVEMKRGSQIFAIFPGASPNAPKPPPSTVYEGGP